MFLIDPEPVRARLSSARAEVAVAKARLDESRRQRDRVLPLFEKNAVSQSRRDEAVSAYEVAQANLQAARIAAAHGAARSRVHRRARADLGPDQSRSDVRGKPRLHRAGVEPADQNRAGRSAVRRIRRAGGGGGVDSQRARAGQQERTAAGREAAPRGRQRVSAAREGHVRRQRRGRRLGHRARARRAAQQGRAAHSRPVRPREGRRRTALERRVGAAQGRHVEPAGLVRLDRRQRSESADASGAGRPQHG